MRKDLGSKMSFLPLPVLIIGTYDENGNANAMNAAWGGIQDYGRIYVSLSQHKTTDNLKLKKHLQLVLQQKKQKLFQIILELYQEIKKIK